MGDRLAEGWTPEQISGWLKSGNEPRLRAIGCETIYGFNRVIVELIGATTTKTGLTVRCELDDKSYPKGIIVSDDEMRSLTIQHADFHGEWNYTIAPSHIKAIDS